MQTWAVNQSVCPSFVLLTASDFEMTFDSMLSKNGSRLLFS